MSDSENRSDGKDDQLSENDKNSDRILDELDSLGGEEDDLNSNGDKEINYEKFDKKKHADGSDDSEGEREEKIKKKENKKMRNVRKKVKKGEDADGEDNDYGVVRAVSERVFLYLNIQSDNESEGETRRKDEKRGKMKKNNRLDEETVARECDELLQAMEEAYRRDRISCKEKKPALEKLKYVNTLDAALKKHQIQERFLNNGGLDMICKWLEKMPDGSPPGQTLKKKLIEIISEMSVDDNHVSNTTLSRRIYELYKNPKEDVDLKKKLKTIIDKFSRVALSMRIDYTSQGEECSFSRRRDYSNSLDENSRVEKVKSIFYNPLKTYDRKELNKRVGYNFTVAPKSVKDKDLKSKNKNAGMDFEKMYSDYKRRKKLKQNRPASVL